MEFLSGGQEDAGLRRRRQQQRCRFVECRLCGISWNPDYQEPAGRGDWAKTVSRPVAIYDVDNVPFQPHSSSIVAQVVKGKTLHLQASWFTKYPWLQYSMARKAVLCYLCMQNNQTPSETQTDAIGSSLSLQTRRWTSSTKTTHSTKTTTTTNSKLGPFLGHFDLINL